MERDKWHSTVRARALQHILLLEYLKWSTIQNASG